MGGKRTLAFVSKGMKISVEGDRIIVSGMVVRGLRGGAIHIADISEVSAEKMDKITYEEVFLIVRPSRGEAIAFGELDEGFAEAEKVLRTRLSGFPSEWRSETERGPAGARKQLWPALA